MTALKEILRPQDGRGANHNLDVALRLIGQGFYVFPAKADDSRAPQTGILWPFQSTQSSVPTRRWWARWPESAVAIDVGKSGLIVIDCDRHHPDEDGVEAFWELAKEHGYSLNDVPQVTTPRRGVHLMFRQRPGEKRGNGTGDLPAGVDARGNGGYVLAAGSVLADGREYTLRGDLSEIPVLPDWLAEILDGRRGQAPDRAPTPTVHKSTSREEAFAKAALQGNIAELEGVREGGRNNALNAIAFRMGRFIGAGWIERDVVEAGLEDACVRNGLWHDDGPPQCQKSIRSGVDAGILEPMAALEQPMGSSNHVHGTQPGAGGRPPQTSIASEESAATMETMTPENWVPASGHAPDGHGASQSGGRVEELLNLDEEEMVWVDPATLPRRQWLYGKALIRGQVSLLVADGGVGKTSLVCTEAMALVTGKKLLYDEVCEGPMRVRLWNLEEKKEEMQRRLEAVRLRYDLGKPHGLFVSTGFEKSLCITRTTRDGVEFVDPTIDALIASLKRQRIDVLIVDPFVSSHDVSENDNREIDAVAKKWALVAHEADCSIQLVHHTTKLHGIEATAHSSRGASSLVGAVRVARVINRMAPDVADEYGLGDPLRFIRVDDAKANYAPRETKARWHKMVSVPLGNGGDEVGVTTQFTLPDVMAGVEDEHLEEVIRRAGEHNYRQDQRSTDWIGKMVAEVLGVDIDEPAEKKKVKEAIRTWIKSKQLEIVEMETDGRKKKKFVVPGSAAWADE